MKKIVTLLLSAVMVLSLALCLAGCGDSPKKQEAIDAFNTTSKEFNEVATLINDNADAIDDEVIEVFQEMSALLSEYKDLLEGDAEISDDKYDEMIEWFGTAQDWFKDAKTEIENAVNAG